MEKNPTKQKIHTMITYSSNTSRRLSCFRSIKSTLAVTAVAATIASAQATVLVQTQFTSTSQGSGFSDNWSTGSLFGNGNFTASGFNTVQNYFLTNRTISGVTLSATPTWVALQSSLESYTIPGSTAFFDFRLNIAGDTTSNINMGANANASPFTQANWGAVFRNGGGFQGIYPGGVAAPAGPNTFLVRLTSDGANISMQAWRFGNVLPGTDPTGAANGAAQYGSWTWSSAGSGISGLRVEGNLDTLSTNFVIADSYSSVLSVIPEPSTAALLGIGAMGFVLLRRKQNSAVKI